jgi:hypothetical protein
MSGRKYPFRSGARWRIRFVLEHDGKAWLFYEDFPTGSLKGRLSCVEIGSGDDRFGQPQVILDLPYHLSYPCLIEDRGEGLPVAGNFRCRYGGALSRHAIPV